MNAKAMDDIRMVYNAIKSEFNDLVHDFLVYNAYCGILSRVNGSWYLYGGQRCGGDVLEYL